MGVVSGEVKLIPNYPLKEIFCLLDQIWTVDPRFKIDLYSFSTLSGNLPRRGCTPRAA